MLEVDACGTSDVLRPILAAAGQHGFDGVDVHVGDCGAGGSETGAPIPAWLAGLCDEMGLPALALTAPCPGFDASQAADEVCRLLHLARSTGVSFLNLLAPQPRAGERYRGQVGGQALINFVQRLLQLVTFEVEASGAVLALAMPGGGSTLSAVELRELIDSAHSWAVGACVDAGCVGPFGSLSDWILTLDRRVFTVRLDDPAGLPGAEGVVRNGADAMSSALQAIAFEGALVATRVETMATIGEVFPLPTRL